MPLSPEIIERANSILDGPITVLRLNPNATDLDIADTAEYLADYVQDFMHVCGSCLEFQDKSAATGPQLARLLFMNARLFELYRVLTDKQSS